MRLRLLFVAGFVVVLVAGACTKKSAPPSQEALKTALEERSGLGTGELFLSKRSFWNNDPKTDLLFEYNAGPGCAKTPCAIKLETSIALKGDFKELAEMVDDGSSGDRVPHDGVYSRRVSFNPPGYHDRTLRFRAGAKEKSAPVFLKVGPRIEPADVTSTVELLKKHTTAFRAISPKDKAKLDDLAKQIASEPGVESAMVSDRGISLLVLHKKGFLGQISRERIPDLRAGGALVGFGSVVKSAVAAKKSCGGWEGDILTLSPYASEFGSSDAAIKFATKLKDDKEGRFKVESRDSAGAWGFEGIFEKKNGIVISSHGGFDDSYENVHESVRYLFNALPNGHFGISQLSTNTYYQTKHLESFFLHRGMIIGQDGEVHLLPYYFQIQRGRMKKNSFAFLSFCHSMDPGFGFHKVFHDHGAAVVFGYDSSIRGGSPWTSQTEDNVIDAILEGKPLSEAKMPSGPDVYTKQINGKAYSSNPLFDALGEKIIVNFQRSLKADDPDAKAVAFQAGQTAQPTLSMKANKQDVKLAPYGCYLHDALEKRFGKVWTCKWTRDGKPDTSPQVTLNFLGEKPPKVGKRIHGIEALFVYGDKECGGYDSMAYPETVDITIKEWSPQKGVSLTFESTVSNNGMIGVSGEDGLKLINIVGGTATSPLLDFAEEQAR